MPPPIQRPPPKFSFSAAKCSALRPTDDDTAVDFIFANRQGEEVVINLPIDALVAQMDAQRMFVTSLTQQTAEGREQIGDMRERGQAKPVQDVGTSIADMISPPAVIVHLEKDTPLEVNYALSMGLAEHLGKALIDDAAECKRIEGGARH